MAPGIAEKKVSLLYGFESFGVIIIGSGVFFLILFENLINSPALFIPCPGLLVAIPLLTVFFVWLPKKVGSLHAIASIFHIVLFTIIFYYPDFCFNPVEGRTHYTGYLLHLFFLISQAIRPGKFPGLPVILFLIAHYSVQIVLSDSSMLADHFLFLLILFWAGFISLFQESVIYFNLITQLESRLIHRYNKSEMVLARNVYNNLFPSFKKNKNLQIHTHHNTRHEAGGDFYDLVFLREGNIGFFITDISGHGISSAMMSAAVKGIITTIPFHKRLSPASFLTHMDHLISKNYGSHHATAIYIYFDFHSKIMKYANAGHPQLLFSKNGEPFQELQSSGSILGFNIRSPIADEYSIPFQPGDRVLLYTDGLLDFSWNHMKTNPSSQPDLVELLGGLEILASDEIIKTLLDRIQSRPDFEEFVDDTMVVILDLFPDAKS